MSSRLRTILLVLVLAVFVGCGQGTEGDRILSGDAASKPLAAEDRLIERRLVGDGDTRQAPQGSAQRAFLEYWSAMSYEDWANAMRYFDVRLRRVLDANYLISALRIEGQNNLPVKPLIRSVSQTRGSVSIRYMVRTGDGRLRATSSSWAQRDDVWYLVYSSTLDDSYGASVQQAVQSDLDPTAKTPSRRAVSAGIRARRTQAETLRLLSPTPTPTPRPRSTATPAPAPAP